MAPGAAPWAETSLCKCLYFCIRVCFKRKFECKIKISEPSACCAVGSPPCAASARPCAPLAAWRRLWPRRVLRWLVVPGGGASGQRLCAGRGGAALPRVGGAAGAVGGMSVARLRAPCTSLRPRSRCVHRGCLGRGLGRAPLPLLRLGALRAGELCMRLASHSARPVPPPGAWSPSRSRICPGCRTWERVTGPSWPLCAARLVREKGGGCVLGESRRGPADAGGRLPWGPRCCGGGRGGSTAPGSHWALSHARFSLWCCHVSGPVPWRLVRTGNEIGRAHV